MPRLSAANILIGRAWNIPARVTDLGFYNTRDFLKHPLYSPKTAGAKNRGFEVLIFTIFHPVNNNNQEKNGQF